MTDHYDPAYQKSRAVRGSKIMSSIHTDGLEDTDLTRVTDALSEALAKI
jgi:hypothetical protein